jgi:pyruvate/2-oxoglutarate dehydrogenase complex dihydrolipoamide acyltransferase (E2) component
MMNAKRQLAVALLLACGAWIQASAAQKPAQSPAPAAKPQAAAAAPAKAKKTPAAKPAGPTAAAPSRPASPSGKRDPFVSLAVVRAQQVGASCGTGKRCLVIDQIDLKGVVKTPKGMIAMVENTAKKAYFLRENDPVFNGYVVKITGDSVIFKENTVDNQGRTQTRDVVKRVSAPAV